VKDEVFFLLYQSHDFKEVEARERWQAVMFAAVHRPSGIKEAHIFVILALRIFQYSHHAICHMRMVPSSLPEARMLPSGLNATAVLGLDRFPSTAISPYFSAFGSVLLTYPSGNFRGVFSNVSLMHRTICLSPWKNGPPEWALPVSSAPPIKIQPDISCIRIDVGVDLVGAVLLV